MFLSTQRTKNHWCKLKKNNVQKMNLFLNSVLNIWTILANFFILPIPMRSRSISNRTNFLKALFKLDHTYQDNRLNLSSSLNNFRIRHRKMLSGSSKATTIRNKNLFQVFIDVTTILREDFFI